MSTVAVIPARGGSKGIPRKNMRLMGGKPLIAYAIENALRCDYIDEVIVSSDSEEILSFAATYEGVTPLNRDSALAQDAVTLDPVIYDAVVRREQELGHEFEIVVTLQPTSPLLTVETLSKALEEFAASDLDTMVSSVNAPHLSWTKDDTGKTVPNYKERLNRQLLPPDYHETGAFVIARRGIVTKDTRFGDRVGVYEVPEVESTDIDTKQDWIVCESLLARKKIAFRVDGYGQLGLGHIYRALTLAYELIEHEVVFICDSSHREGIDCCVPHSCRSLRLPATRSSLPGPTKINPMCLSMTVSIRPRSMSNVSNDPPVASLPSRTWGAALATLTR